MSSQLRRTAIFLVGLIGVIDQARGDALVVTKAMQASTIVEMFIEESEVRVNLEVGSQDLAAFQNLLPDDLHEKLTGQSKPWDTRLRRFLSSDWLVFADDQQLDGTLDHFEIAKRVVRDEMTGDPLPNQPDDAELVIQVELRYPLHGQPASISIQPPRVGQSGWASANIGFVTYHQGVAVNDFRYLSAKETLRLDWTDPWYTAFERRNLRRRYFAPAAAFLYVENFEVRKEIVFRPKDLQDWVDLGLQGKSTIPTEQREAILEEVAPFLAEHTPVQINGRPARGTLDRIHFIHRSLRTTGVLAPEEELDVHTAMIGAIYIYPVTSLPQEVTMSWDLFNERIERVPCVATDEAGGMPWALQPDDPILNWKNFLTNPTQPAFMEVSPPVPPQKLSIPIVAVFCLAGAVVLWAKARQRDRARRPYGPIAILFGAAVAMLAVPGWRVDVPIAGPPEVSDRDTGDILYSLLHNIYRAFDYRDESTVYDVLARSANGDLLTQIYLETRRSLTLASQGGARVKVKAIDLVDYRRRPADDGALVAQCRWIVKGNVGHWGHIHERTNQYRAEFVIRQTDGQWKITGMDLLSEERL